MNVKVGLIIVLGTVSPSPDQGISSIKNFQRILSTISKYHNSTIAQ